MTVKVYHLTKVFPRDEIFGLTSQIRRASVSVASNIAEGYGRNSRNEYKHFLGMARGSNLEVQTHLVLASELAYCNPEWIQEAESLSEEVAKMLNAMIPKL